MRNFQLVHVRNRFQNLLDNSGSFILSQLLSLGKVVEEFAPADEFQDENDFVGSVPRLAQFYDSGVIWSQK